MRNFAISILIFGGCAAPAAQDGNSPDLANGTGGVGYDLAIPNDLATDPARPDLTSGADLAVPPDLAVAADLMGVVSDMRAAPSDLATPPDLTAPPDLMPMCVPKNITGSICNDVPQCGCPAGQACAVVNTTTGATGCIGAGHNPPLSTCTSDSDCAPGSACVGGVCAPYCNSANDCAPHEGCVPVTSDGTNNIPGFTVCTSNCNPLAPTSSSGGYNACGSGLACYPGQASPDNGSGSCLGPVGTGTQGADCTGTNGTQDYTKCAAGYVCIKITGFGTTITCQKFCQVSKGTADCSSVGGACNSFSPKQYAGGGTAAANEIGFCY